MAARWPTQNTTVAHITLSETAREIMRFGDGERNYASRPNTTGSAASSRDDGAQAGDGGEGTWRHDGQRRIRRSRTSFGDGERNYASRPNTRDSATSSRDDGAQSGESGERNMATRRPTRVVKYDVLRAIVFCCADWRLYNDKRANLRS
jgi:hypothetical protein